MDHTKIDTAYLDFPRQELSNSDLGNVVALPFFQESIFLCACTGGSTPSVLSLSADLF